jgi:hypothetical protein
VVVAKLSLQLRLGFRDFEIAWTHPSVRSAKEPFVLPMALVVPLDPDRRVMCTAPVDVLWCFDNRLVDMRYHDESPRTQTV